MAQVIDASVAIAWCAENQATRMTEAAMDAVVATGGHVPAVFWFEVLHGLAGLVNRKIIARGDIDEFVEQIAEFRIEVAAQHGSAEVPALYGLARRHALNIYDAAYLDIALRFGLPLATQDERLARAAEAAGARLFRP